MKIAYDPSADAAYIRLKKGKFQSITHRLTEDIAINFAPDGSVVGIEILSASRYFAGPKHRQITLENLQAVS